MGIKSRGTDGQQTNIDPEKCPTTVFYSWGHICSDRWPLAICELTTSISDRVTTSFKSSNLDYTPTWQSISSNGSTTCRLMFKIPEDMGAPVYMYYRLTDFYQNHRRYVKSLDLDQLKGKAVDNKTIDSGTCDPLRLDPSGKAYYPCGLIANSMFNDTINSPELLSVANDVNPEPYIMTNKNIAWDSDKELIKKTEYTKDQVVPPPNWRERYPDGYANGIPDLNQDEEFMVWMRTAALPTFSKLARRNDTAKMPAGMYRLDIVDRFPVAKYGGTKSILITTRTVIGGQNPFMGIAYVVVGGICVLLGTLFTIAHLVRPRKDIPRPRDIPRSYWQRLSSLYYMSRISVVLVVAIIKAHCNPLSPHIRGVCATNPPSDLLKAEYQKLSLPPPHNESTGEFENRIAETPIVIDTWFHILSDEIHAGLVSDEMVTNQINTLQDAYQDALITYKLRGITRQVNASWARNEDEMAMKNALRKGSYSTLNVYFHTDLQSQDGDGAPQTARSDARSDAGGRQRVLGFCTLPDPSISRSSLRAAYAKDGCNVLAQTMPGGPLDHYNRGGTAVHEIGHWNGLLHIFEGESCSPDNPGDYISDTPQQSKPTEGCPSSKDSCPDNPGMDAIHNYMDYSSDDCYESFTPDQLDRMRHMWSAMRDGK
ncbi:Cell cycle control protein [Aspergillus nanangensis]|uniref:Cell cycle control protein n=1 Tax=Aspergillus nanangensis TaxID=2582783 RepID=A0AAD4CF96_ASPNN|nr:Cell cycle control protein [Aspergillus nanangensis]